MSCDCSRPEILISLSNDIEASALVGALAQYGIDATAVGGFISGFKADAPSSMDILVKCSDLDRARQALAEIHEREAEDIDWDSVDVMEGAEEDVSAVEADDAESQWQPVAGRVWWVVVLLIIGVGTIFSLLTGSVHPLEIILVLLFIFAQVVYVATRFFP